MKQLTSFLVALVLGAVIGHLTSESILFMFSFVIIIVFAQFFTYIKFVGKYYFYAAMGALIGYLTTFFELFGVDKLLL